MDEEKINPEQGDISSDAEISLLKKLGKKKIFTIVSVAVAVVIAAVLAVMTIFVNYNLGYDAEPAIASAIFTEDGTAHIPLYNGKSIKIDGDVKSAYLTKDKKHIVVFLNDGTLYVTDQNLSNKKVVSENCSELSFIKNDGIFYIDEDGKMVRVLFSDYSSTSLLRSEISRVKIANDGVAFVYVTKDGAVYLQKGDASEVEELGTYSGAVEIEAVSADGKLSLISIKEEENHTLVLNNCGAKTVFEKIDINSEITATLSKDQKIMVITDSKGNKIWIVNSGADTVAAELPAELKPAFDLYTEKGLLSDTKSSDFISLYIPVINNGTYSLYCVLKNGQTKCVIDYVNGYKTENGKIYFLKDRTFFCANVSGTDIGQTIKIGENITDFKISGNGKFVYYLTNAENGVGDVYCYKAGIGKPILISTKAVLGPVSIDGRTVFYYTNIETIGDVSCGTLVKQNCNSEKKEIISDKVVINSASVGLATNEVMPASFMYLKYISETAENKILADWMYYNGQKSTEAIKNIILP